MNDSDLKIFILFFTVILLITGLILFKPFLNNIEYNYKDLTVIFLILMSLLLLLNNYNILNTL